MCIGVGLNTPAPASNFNASPGAVRPGSAKYRPSGSAYKIDAVKHGRMSGADNMAQLHRAMWEDHKQRFQPVQQMLVDTYSDPTRTSRQVRQAGLTMGQSFDNSWSQGQRALERRGVTPSGDQATAQRRSFERNKAGAVADAKNTARSASRDQKMGLMQGGLTAANRQRNG